MAEVPKVLSYSLILIGIVLFLQAIGSIYVLAKVGSMIDAIRSASYGSVPSYTAQLVLGWIFSIFTLIAGLVTIFAGISLAGLSIRMVKK